MLNHLIALTAILCMPPLVAATQPPSPTFPATAGTTIRVVFDKPSPRPGVRLMELTRTANG